MSLFTGQIPVCKSNVVLLSANNIRPVEKAQTLEQILVVLLQTVLQTPEICKTKQTYTQLAAAGWSRNTFPPFFQTLEDRY